MVYVYATQGELNKYIGKNLSVEEIETTLKDLGMDIKGVSEDDDPELKIELTAEKLDLISAVGIARAVKYYMGLAKEVPRYNIAKAKNAVIVEKSASQSRPKTVAAILRDVPMTEEYLDEMIKIQEKIHDSFGRGRKKAAIGIYPIDKIKFPVKYKSENPEEIIFRPLNFDYEINGLDILEKHETGKKYAHLLEGFSMFPVFRDATDKVLSLPPIINSHDTGKVEVEHKDLFIELTGYNVNLLDKILKVLVSTFIEMGAKAEAVKVKYEDSGEEYELNLDNYYDTISLDYINSLIGVKITEKKIEGLLNKVMYGVKSMKDGKIKIEIPSFRSDVWHDVDIADDVARAYGYNNIVPTFPSVPSVGEHLEFTTFKDNVTEMMVNMGYIELYTYILSSSEVQFKKMNLNVDDFKYVKLIDSADEGLNMCRISVLPENLMSLHINRKNKYPQKVFENGFTLQVDEKTDTGAINQAHLSVSIADPKSNYTQIKGVLDSLMSLLEVEFSVQDCGAEYLIKGRRAEIIIDSEIVGFIGEVHPDVLENFGLLVPVASLEINLNKLYQIMTKN